MDIQELIQIVEDFGLPCIIRNNVVTIVGVEEMIELNLEEILNDN